MAKIYKFYNPSKTVDVEVITDGIGDQETFAIRDIVGINSLSTRKGLVFNEIGVHITEYSLLQKAVATNLTCAVYDDGDFIENLNEYENEEAEILTFSLAAQTGAATIDSEAGTIDIEVANGTTITALVATFTLSTGASAKVATVAQVSAVTANNFTSPVTYAVTSEHGEVKNWVVSVSVAA